MVISPSLIREQEVVAEFVDGSILPKLVVDVTDGRVDRIVKQIADWLEATGGLTSRLTVPPWKSNLNRLREASGMIQVAFP